MIYVTDNFSMLMIEEDKCEIRTRKIRKREFIEGAKEAITSIGSKKIAKLLKRKITKKNLTLKKGDQIYIITSKFGRRKSGYKKENEFRYEVFSIV